MHLVHISDPHFGTEQMPVLEALRAWVARQPPALVMLGGDITQRARRTQFAAARDFMDSLRCPFLAVPGNHDIPLFNLPQRILSPYGNYQSAFGDDLEPIHEDPRLLVIGVNSTTPRRHKDGEVSAAQIQRVRDRLARAAPEQLRIVLQHHPVRAQQDSDVHNLMYGRAEAVPAWVDAGMDLLLAGHIHLPYVLPLQGTVGRRGWTVQAGTSLSHRVRGAVPNSFNVIRHEGGSQCVVERWDYDDGCQDFACHDSQALTLSR